MGNAATTIRSQRRRQGRQRRPASAELPLPTTLEGVETFAIGEYPGNVPGEVWSYTAADLAKIIDNFALLSEGEKPLHKVPIVVTHDKAHAYAWVKAAEQAGDLLLTDWERVEPTLARRIRAGRLLKVSPEILRDFTDRTGKVFPGPYLYRLSVLGADVPRVKGLADLDESFADRMPGRRLARPFKFADPSRNFTMNREQATAYLTQMGIDPAAITADVPDAFLIAVAQAWSDEEDTEPDAGGNGDGGAGNGGTPPRTRMDDGNPPAPKKRSVTETYADPASIRKLVAREVGKALAPAIKAIGDAGAAEAKAREERAALERQATVRLFCDERAKENRLTPAENDEADRTSVRSRLLRLAAAPPVTRKFADPKDAAKTVELTELEIQLEEITGRPARKFAERVHQGGGQGEGGDRTGTGASAEYAARTKAYWEKRGGNRNGAGAK